MLQSGPSGVLQTDLVVGLDGFYRAYIASDLDTCGREEDDTTFSAVLFSSVRFEYRAAVTTLLPLAQHLRELESRIRIGLVRSGIQVVCDAFRRSGIRGQRHCEDARQVERWQCTYLLSRQSTPKTRCRVAVWVAPCKTCARAGIGLPCTCVHSSVAALCVNWSGLAGHRLSCEYECREQGAVQRGSVASILPFILRPYMLRLAVRAKLRLQVAQVACGLPNRWAPAPKVLTSNLFALYGLLGTASVDRRLKQLLASKRAGLGMWLSGIVGECRGRRSAAQPARRDLTTGVRVFHEGRGKGQVVQAEADATGSTVYLVQFDGGAVHSYSCLDAQRLRLVQMHEEPLVPGVGCSVGPDVVVDISAINSEAHLELDTAPAIERQHTAAGCLVVASSIDVVSKHSDETESRMAIRVDDVDFSPFHIGSESRAPQSQTCRAHLTSLERREAAKIAERLATSQAVAWRQTDLAELSPSAAAGVTRRSGGPAGDRPGALRNSASIAVHAPRAKSVASDGMLCAKEPPGIGLMAEAHWHYDRALSALLASGSLDAQSNLRFAKADDQQHSARTSSAARTTRFGRSAPKLP